MLSSSGPTISVVIRNPVKWVSVTLCAKSIIIPTASTAVRASYPMGTLVGRSFPLFIFPGAPVYEQFTSNISFRITPVYILLLIHFTRSIVVSAICSRFMSSAFRTTHRAIPTLYHLVSHASFVVVWFVFFPRYCQKGVQRRGVYPYLGSFFPTRQVGNSRYDY